MSEFIAVNRKVELIKQEGEKKQYYRSVIQDVGEDTFAIDIPTKKGVPWMPYRWEILQMSIITERARYEFDAKVLRKKIKPLPLIILQKPSPKDVRRIQLRDHVRVSLVADVFYQFLAAEEVEQYKNVELEKQGTSLDISGGGMRLAIDRHCEIGARLVVAFKLEEQEFKLLGQVQRCLEQDLPEKRLFLIGIAFEEITLQEQDWIVAFCFRRQLETGR